MGVHLCFLCLVSLPAAAGEGLRSCLLLKKKLFGAPPFRLRLGQARWRLYSSVLSVQSVVNVFCLLSESVAESDRCEANSGRPGSAPPATAERFCRLG